METMKINKEKTNEIKIVNNNCLSKTKSSITFNFIKLLMLFSFLFFIIIYLINFINKLNNNTKQLNEYKNNENNENNENNDILNIKYHYYEREKITSKMKKYAGWQLRKNEPYFINGIIRKFKPKKCLEIGVAKGGSSIIILNALKDIDDSFLVSLDLNSFNKLIIIILEKM